MPTGEYAIDRSLHDYLFDLNGCSDIVVDGTGVKLNFSSRKQGLIRSRDSERIAETGFDVSYATGALRVQGRVTAHDPANRRVTVQVEPRYPGFDASDNPKHDIFHLLDPGKWMTGNTDGVHIRGHRLGP